MAHVGPKGRLPFVERHEGHSTPVCGMRNAKSKFCTRRSPVHRETWGDIWLPFVPYQMLRDVWHTSDSRSPGDMGRQLAPVRALSKVERRLAHAGLKFVGRHGETFGSHSCLIKCRETFGTRRSPIRWETWGDNFVPVRALAIKDIWHMSVLEYWETFDTRQCLEKCRETFCTRPSHGRCREKFAPVRLLGVAGDI